MPSLEAVVAAIEQAIAAATATAAAAAAAAAVQQRQQQHGHATAFHRTASTSRFRLRSSSLRSSSNDSCCSNWRSGCWSGHSRSSKACAGGLEGGRAGLRVSTGRCQPNRRRQLAPPPKQPTRLLLLCTLAGPAHLAHCEAQLRRTTCTPPPRLCCSIKPLPIRACSTAHLAHCEAQLGGGRPALAQADLKEGARDAGRVLCVGEEAGRSKCV